MFYEPSTQKTHASIEAFRMAHRNTSYGELLSEEERNHFGLFTLHQNIPPYDAKLHYIENGPIEQQEGRYVQTYVIKEKLLSVETKIKIITSRMEGALYDHYDAVARDNGWDNRQSILQRAGYPNPYRDEAEAFGVWMGECDLLVYKLINEVVQGSRTLPEAPAFFLQGLPKFKYVKS